MAYDSRIFGFWPKVRSNAAQWNILDEQHTHLIDPVSGGTYYGVSPSGGAITITIGNKKILVVAGGTLEPAQLLVHNVGEETFWFTASSSSINSYRTLESQGKLDVSTAPGSIVSRVYTYEASANPVGIYDGDIILVGAEITGTLNIDVDEDTYPAMFAQSGHKMLLRGYGTLTIAARGGAGEFVTLASAGAGDWFLEVMWKADPTNRWIPIAWGGAITGSDVVYP